MSDLEVTRGDRDASTGDHKSKIAIYLLFSQLTVLLSQLAINSTVDRGYLKSYFLKWLLLPTAPFLIKYMASRFSRINIATQNRENCIF